MKGSSGTLSWDEALRALEKGLIVRNRNFTSEEFFEMRNGRLFAEDGCSMAGWYLGLDWQKEGWSVIDDPRGID